MKFKNFDSKVPKQLREIQQWFGNIISRPIDEKGNINPVAPSGKSISIESKKYIIQSPTLQPDERIEIYNRQYWWRLLSILRDASPFLIHLLGEETFNKHIATPYLVKYPPQHWSLTRLNDRLTKWIEEEYSFEDKELIVNASKIDYAFNASFIVKTSELLPEELFADPVKFEVALTQKLYTQPHIHLFVMPGDLFSLCDAICKHPKEYWETHELPSIVQDRSYYFVLYRNKEKDISWKEISKSEHFLLSLLQKGSTIDEACEQLSQDSFMFDEAVKHLQGWFQEWTARQWLSFASP